MIMLIVIMKTYIYIIIININISISRYFKNKFYGGIRPAYIFIFKFEIQIKYNI